MTAPSRATLPPPRAVLLDWDNTLVDNWTTITEAFNTTLIAMGQQPWTIGETRTRVRASLRDSFPRLFGKRWQEAKRIYVEAFAIRHLQTLQPLPEAETLLRALGERSLWVGVVSNKTGTFLRKEVRHLGWGRYFRRVIGAGDAPNDKPAPDPVHLALAESGVAAGPEVWFVGDTEMDMECAHASGCVPVLLSAEPADPLVYAGRLPVWQGAGCADLARLIQSMGEAGRSPDVL